MSSPTRYDFKCYTETFPVVLDFKYFESGQRYIRLIHADEGDVVAKVTINVPEAELQPGEVIVKTWSENEGMLPFLLSNGIVKETGRQIILGVDCRAVICELLV